LDALIRRKLPVGRDAPDADAPDAYYPYPAQTAATFDGRRGPEVACTLRVQACLHAAAAFLITHYWLFAFHTFSGIFQLCIFLCRIFLCRIFSRSCTIHITPASAIVMLSTNKSRNITKSTHSRNVKAQLYV